MKTLLDIFTLVEHGKKCLFLDWGVVRPAVCSLNINVDVMLKGTGTLVCPD